MAKARGILFHHFWGEYSAGIQLVFCEDPGAPLPHEVRAATDALALLNADPEIALLSGGTAAMNPIGGPLSTDRGWKLVEKKAALTITVDSAGVDLIEKQLRRQGLIFEKCGWSHCEDQCAGQSIGGTPHSIDNGPLFEVDIDVMAARQISLFWENV